AKGRGSNFGAAAGEAVRYTCVLSLYVRAVWKYSKLWDMSELQLTRNLFTCDPIPESFDEVSPNPPPQFHFNIYLCQICESNSHYGYECSQRVSLVYEPEPCYIQNFSDNDYSHDLPDCEVLSEADHCQPPQYTVNHPIFNGHNDSLHYQNELTVAQNKLMEQMTQLTSICEMACQIVQKKQEERKLKKSKRLKLKIQRFSLAGDEHLNTCLVTESDEFIQSCVENLVPNPSESEGENGCDVLAGFTTFSNILFDAEYESDSSDDQSLFDEGFPKEIFSNPLFEEEIISTKIDPHHFDDESDLIESMLNHDSSIISSSSKIDSLLDEFADELTRLKSISPRIDETDCYHDIVFSRDCCTTTHLLVRKDADQFLAPLPGRPSDTPVCYLCTYEQCGNILNYGTCLNCNSGTGNSFTYDLIPKSFDEVSPNPPPQFHFNIYLFQICINPLIDHHCCYECGNSLNDFFCHQCTCEFSGNGAHVGYIWLAQVLSFQTLPSFPQQYPCCKDCEKIKEEQAAKAQNSKIPACCDDDDDYNSAITPNEPVDSLSMGDEYLNTIPATESNEFIKSCFENLVPNPSESEGENSCDMLACFTTFSNILFDAEYEFDSSGDQSLFDEDFPEEIFLNPLFEEEIISTKIDPHHFDVESDLIESMLNHDSSIISSSLKIDSLLDEFADELTRLKSIPPRIDETDCYPENDIRLIERLLYDNSSPRPSEKIVSENSDAEIESFSPFPYPH
nr:hypothetical protein [Tanacetum cinerariifolium]